METKKSPKANLEKKRFLLLELGFIMALGICFAAFEWSTPEANSSNLGQLSKTEDFEPEMQATVTPPPPKVVKPEPVVIPEVIEITEKPILDDIPDFVSDPTDGGVSPVIFIGEDPLVEPPDEAIPVEFYLVEVKPVYPGGEGEMFKFIRENAKYPEIPKENGIGGTVHVGFVIDVNGKVTNVYVARGVDPHLDKEAVRVVSAMPFWTPGMQRTVKVPVSYIIPIKFTIN